MEVHFKSAQSEHLKGILSLQQENLSRALSHEEVEKEGFVTVSHTLQNLKKISGSYRHSIAVNGSNEVVGFALVMLKEYRNEIKILVPMFDLIDQLSFKGKLISETRYVVMGQVCVSKEVRKQGVFSKLYTHLAEATQKDFDYIITEVSSNNKPSLKAHTAIGFELLHQHTSESGEVWNVVILAL